MEIPLPNMIAGIIATFIGGVITGMIMEDSDRKNTKTNKMEKTNKKPRRRNLGIAIILMALCYILGLIVGLGFNF